MSAVELSNGEARIIVRPDLGAGLTGYDVRRDGEWLPIFRRVDPETRHPFGLSNILLAPFSGRISGGGFSYRGVFHAIERNMAMEKYPIHGGAFSSAWSVVEQTQNSIALVAAASGPGPFRYDAEMTYRLDGAALRMQLRITNRAAITLPHGGGFHPWFVRDRDTFLTARAEHVWLEQPDHLPAGRDDVSHHPNMDFNMKNRLPSSWINNWFVGWDGKARVDWPERQLSVEITASEDLDQYVVFSPAGDADFFCFEPVSHPVDAFNLPEGPEAHGMKALAPGQSLEMWANFEPVPRPH